MRRLLIVCALLMSLLGSPNRSWAQDDARAIIDKAINALGGEARLARYKARQNKTRGLLHSLGGVPFTQEVFYQSPNQIKEVLRAGAEGKEVTITTALNGDKGWMQADGPAQPLNERVLAELKETAHLRLVCRCTVLKDRAYQLSLLGDFPIDNRPTVGIRVSTRGYRELQLYFDKELGLLVKTERLGLNPQTGKPFREEAYYKDWKAIEGIVTPTRVVVYHDGQRFMEAEAYDIRYLEKLDDRMFAKP